MGIDDLVDKAKDLAGKGKDIAGDVVEKTKDVTGDVVEKTKDVAEKRQAEDAKEVTEVAKGEGSLTDKAKAAVDAVKDPGKPGPE